MMIYERKLKRVFDFEVPPIITVIFVIFMALLGIASIYSFAGGFASRSSCLKKPARIQKYFPAYKLGCYLGSTEGSQYYYEEKVIGDLIYVEPNKLKKIKVQSATYEQMRDAACALGLESKLCESKTDP